MDERADVSQPQWPGAAGPGQQFPAPGQPPGQPYAPAPGYHYGPPPGQPYAPAPGYPYGPYGPPPGQYGPWGYLPPAGPPRSRRRRGLWIAGGLVLVVAVVVAGVLARQLGGAPAPRSPNASAVELLVAQGDFPKLPPPARFSVTVGSGDDDADLGAVNVSPPECADVLGDAEVTTDTAKADLSNAAARGGDGPRSYTVRVVKSADPHYLDNLTTTIDECDSVSIDREGVRVDGTVVPVTVSDTAVPVTGVAAKFVSHAYGVKVAMTMQLLATVVRGTAVEVSAKRMSINAARGFDKPDKGAVDLIGKQIDKIEDAP